MTDLVTGSTPTTENDQPTAVVSTLSDETATTASGDGAEGGPGYAWAPEEPKRRKRHLGLWLGIPGGALGVAVIAASLILIAPGTAVAGVPLGGLTVGGAAGALEDRLATTEIEISTAGGPVTVTGADLGASIDAEALAQQAFAQHPLWNVTQWNSEPIEAEVTLDPAVADEALRSAVPGAFVDASDAGVAFDAASATYVVSPGTDGQGIDLLAVQDALSAAFSAGTDGTLDGTPVTVEADVTTADAEQAAGTLNHMLEVGGFYVGEERTVPLDRATLASWLTVSDTNGSLELSADAAAIQTFVDTLPGLVNRAPVNATVITNPSGEALSDITAGANGRELGDTSGIADGFASALAAGDAQYQLPVTETAFQTTSLARRIDVNLSTQTATLYENDAVVGSYTVSSGLSPNNTPTGNFAVFAHVREQDMGALCYNPAAQNSYCTKDVPWVTYFAPDIAFHGASAFRSRLGFPQSHGCVNMWNDDAKFVYGWAVTGVPVSVHY